MIFYRRIIPGRRGSTKTTQQASLKKRTFLESHSSTIMSDPAASGGGEAGGGGPRKEIYTYAAPWTVFAMAWSRRYERKVSFSVKNVYQECS